MDFYTVKARIKEKGFYNGLDRVKLREDIVQAIIDEVAMTKSQAEYIYNEVESGIVGVMNAYDIDDFCEVSYMYRRFLNVEDK